MERDCIELPTSNNDVALVVVVIVVVGIVAKQHPPNCSHVYGSTISYFVVVYVTATLPPRPASFSGFDLVLMEC